MYVLDPIREKAVRQFGNKLIGGNGLAPWQDKVITELLATVDSETGERQYHEAFIAVAKKNGKTRLVSTIVCLLLSSAEKQKEIYSVASTRDQAAIVFRDVAEFVRNNPKLRKRLKVVDSRKRIVDFSTGSFYQALSSDAGFSDGIRPSVVIYDELHRAKDRALYDLLRKSMPTIKSPLFITITTAGDDRTSICYELWEYARKVRDGIIQNERFYPLIFEAKPEDDFKAPETWKKANPSLGLFLNESAISAECKRAIDSPSSLNSFLRYHLNIWTERDSTYLDMNKYDSRSDVYPVRLLEGQVCYVGIDLASSRDLSAICLLFPLPTGEYVVLPRMYMPQDCVKEWEDRDKINYSSWIQQGYITATPGNITDYDFIRKEIAELAKLYKIGGVAIDRFDASQISVQLDADGYPVQRFSQTFINYAAPTRELERLVNGSLLIHGNNPVLRWNLSNVVVDEDYAGNIRPNKKKSKNKIDAAVALIMALAISKQPTKKEEYVGLITI